MAGPEMCHPQNLPYLLHACYVCRFQVLLALGSSINYVTHFLRFFTLPLTPILINKLMDEHHPLANPPPPLMGDVIFGQALTKETINVVISAAKG